MTERVFKAIDRNGTESEFELKTPGLSEENEGERQYRIAYSKALVEGVFPKEKIREVMREHGMWTDDDDAQLKKVVQQIALKQMQLHDAETRGDEEACLKLAKAINDCRRRMWELFLIQQTVYMNSAEGVAELVKTEAIMSACTVRKATGERYWKDYKEYVTERDHNTKSTVYENVVRVQTDILNEVRESMNEGFAEHKYLKSVEERVFDREIEDEVTRLLQDRLAKAKETEETEETEETPSKPVRKKTTRKKRTTKK